MNSNPMRSISMDGEKSMQRDNDTENSGNKVTSGRKTRMPFALRKRVLAAAALSCILLTPSRTISAAAPDHDERIVTELSALGKQGDIIARAREQVLEILQQNNACTAWFQESDPDPAEVFRSLHFELEERGPSYVYGMRDPDRGQLFKHPWAAKSFEYGGRSSTITLNARGPFFNRTSRVLQLDPGGMVARPIGNLQLAVSPYTGNSPGAQIVILLHELGHITGRLPEDNDSWDGRSTRNTSEVMRHCKAVTRAAVHNNSRSNN